MGHFASVILPALSKALKKGWWEDTSLEATSGGHLWASPPVLPPPGWSASLRGPRMTPTGAQAHTGCQASSDSITQTAAGCWAKSFQQRCLSSWQTSKFYVWGLF